MYRLILKIKLKFFLCRLSMLSILNNKLKFLSNEN